MYVHTYERSWTRAAECIYYEMCIHWHQDKDGIWVQGSPQEFLPAGEKAGEAWQVAGGPGALPRKSFGLLPLNMHF